jgi:hypothetical protein
MTADVKRADAPPAGEDAEVATASPPPRSPASSWAWLLRASAVAAVLSGIMSTIVAPGVRGNAGEPVVVAAERAAASLSYFLFGALLALILGGAIELVRAREVPAAPRVALVVGGAGVIALSSTGLQDRVPPPLAVLIAAAAAAACLAGAYCAARTRHTRAIAGVLVAFAFASIARLAAWELATRAGDTASVGMFAWSRGVATGGVLLEAAGQLLAVTWLSSRGRWSGQLACSAAMVGAFVLTWGVASGVHSGAAPWQSVLHTALADAPGLPSPYRLDGLATFLVPASILLALVAAIQQRQVVAVVTALALALVSRGAFDAPLRAMCAVVAAQWATLASIDERAMWRALLDERSRRIRDTGAGDSAPPMTS